MKTIPLVRISLVLLVAAIAAATIMAQEKATSLPSLYKPSGGRTTFTPDQATTPETAAFAYMRRLSASSLLSPEEIRGQISKFRTMAQDHERKGMEDWLGPEEFRRRRLLYSKFLKEAQEALKPPKGKTTTPFGASNPAAEGEKKKAQATALLKVHQAAEIWPDPLVRSFLMGLANMQSKTTLASADKNFRECIRLAPRLGVFHQARGAALMEMERPLDAAEEFGQALRLSPDSRSAQDRLRAALAKVPGAEMRRPTYIQAQELLKEHEGGSTAYNPSSPFSGGSSLSNTSWPMPGKVWTAANREYSLPLPPYDRLVFRQAVAVPVAKNTLLVDAEVLKNALEVTVQIDDKTVAVAKVKSSSGAKAAMPLALLTVTGYTFTPVGGDKNTAFEAPMTAEICALSSYEEMGSTVRQSKVKIKSIDTSGVVKLEDKLLAGESASPVLTVEGILVGFLAAKTDMASDEGGPNKLYSLKEILPLIPTVSKTGGGGHLPLGNPGTASTTKKAEGKYFVVRVVTAELMDK